MINFFKEIFIIQLFGNISSPHLARVCNSCLLNPSVCNRSRIQWCKGNGRRVPTKNKFNSKREWRNLRNEMLYSGNEYGEFLRYLNKSNFELFDLDIDEQ